MLKFEEADEGEEKEEKDWKTARAKEVSHEWEQLHENKPLRVRQSEDTTNGEYASFYEPWPNDGEDHLAMKHVSMEDQLGL